MKKWWQREKGKRKRNKKETVEGKQHGEFLASENWSVISDPCSIIKLNSRWNRSSYSSYRNYLIGFKTSTFVSMLFGMIFMLWQLQLYWRLHV